MDTSCHKGSVVAYKLRKIQYQLTLSTATFALRIQVVLLDIHIDIT
jgi:hypothetical protein